uniref:Porin family protein n=1 Tax=Prevotella sp. GTC17253 TaxID=3236793 RepID=A0AB33IRD3_9BACT
MKKIILSAALMLTTVAAFAQHAVGTLTLQPKVGMNIANLTKSDNDARIGLAAGAELEYQASDIVSVSAGALYSMQGAKAGNLTTKLDYINVPILANVYVAKGLAVKLGVQPGFNVNSEYKVKAGKADAAMDIDVKTVDFSIPVGLSYEYNNFVVDGRYNWGLTKVSDYSDSKNSVFQVTLGYKFAL